jgi:enoyl-CoA hydratase
MAKIMVKKGRLTEISINRPEKHNALDSETLGLLSSAVIEASSDKTCSAIIISGSGGKAFSAGADLNYLSEISSARDAEDAFDTFYSAYKCIWDSPKPVIATINGYCLGGGNELAMACDFRIATPNSTFGQPEVRLGIVPGGGATYRLATLVGLQKARELIFTGKTINAEEALNIGLIDSITSSESLIKEAEKLCDAISSASAKSISSAKRAINYGIGYDQSEEKRSFVECFVSGDAKEGISAFIEHRTPKFNVKV